MKRVSFSAMKDGTAKDFQLIAENDQNTAKELPERILSHLALLEHDDGAYHISRLDHSLQCATRAERDDADKEWVIAALLHDIGDILAPFTHANVAYEILRPFVREEVAWTIRHHAIFQMYYNKALPDEKRNLREGLKSSPYYNKALHFVEQWDQASFDPKYDTFPLSHFKQLVEEIFTRDPKC